MSDKPSAYVEDGVSVYRASAVGGCPKALTAARLGFTEIAAPESMQARFRDGHLHEKAVLRDLIDLHGWEIDEHYLREDAEQDAVELQVTPTVVIRGHIDGEGLYMGRRVIEVKALSQSSFDSWVSKGWTAWPKYAAQLSVYMQARELPAAFVVKNKNSGELNITLVETPPMNVDLLAVKVLQVEGWALKGELPPCDKVSYPCPVFYLHEDSENEGVELGDEQRAEGIRALAETYDLARIRLGMAEAVKDEARGKLLEALGTDAKVDVNGWRVQRVNVNRRQLDKEKVRAKVGDEEYSALETVIPSTQLRVNKRGD